TYTTLPCAFTRDPRTGTRNVGMYRLQVFDDRTLGMHWQTHKGGAEHERLTNEFRGTEPHRTSSRPPTVGAGPGDPATTEPHRTSSTPPTVGPGPGDPAKVMPVAIALGGDRSEERRVGHEHR